MKPEAGVISVVIRACLSCKKKTAFCDSVSHPFILCLPHFPPLPSLSSIPTSPFQPTLLCSDFHLFLAHSSSGSELETVEGPPDVPRLHRDEDPTLGSLVQQEEAIVDGPGEEQNRKPPEEVAGHLAMKPQQPTNPPNKLDLGVSVQRLRAVMCLNSSTICYTFWGKKGGKSSHSIISYYLFVRVIRHPKVLFTGRRRTQSCLRVVPK